MQPPQLRILTAREYIHWAGSAKLRCARGRTNVRLLWPLYLTLFTTYAYTMARLEVWLLRRPEMFGLSIATLAAAAVIVSRA